MEKYYSKINGSLLHMIVRKEDMTEGRQNLIEPENFIQCSALQMNHGQTFKAHKHIVKTMTLDVIAQESWCVVNGSVRCIFYDTDNTFLASSELYPGDASFTLAGGHNYVILEDNTLVYEYKTGPYLGQELDKEFI